MFWPTPGPALAAQPTIVVHWEPLVDISHPQGKLAIDLPTVKKFLNLPVEDTFYDLERTAMILAAQKAVEVYCEINLVSCSFTGTLPGLYDHVRLDKRPFLSVESINYVDEVTGVVTLLDPTTYVVGPAPQRCGMISRGDDIDWPTIANRWDAVRIVVNCGWANGLPEDLQQALLMTIGAIDKSRGDDGGSGGSRSSVFAIKHPGMFGASAIIPNAAKALLNPYVLRQVVLA